MKVNSLKTKKTALWAAIAATCMISQAEVSPDWKPIGELQFASMKAMGPQIAELGRQANFTLLPMLVQQGIAGSEPGQAFGAPPETADWGMKLFMKTNTVAGVIAWPIAKAPAPGAPLPKDAALTKDGKWACLCEDAALAKEVAQKGVSFPKPLKKGFCSLTIDGRELLDRMEDLYHGIAEDAKEMAKKDKNAKGLQVKQDACALSVCAFAKDLDSLVAVLGVSKRGLDLRFRAKPRAGSDIAGASKPLPKDILDLMKEGESEVKSFVGSPTAAKDVAAWQDLMAALPESKEAKEPLFAFKTPIIGAKAPPKDGKDPAASTLAAAWGFAWREGKDYRLIVRIPSAELAKAMMEMVKVQGGAPQ